MTPEGKVKKKVSAILKGYSEGIYYNMPVPSGYGESMLDYVGCARGAFFMIETKANDKPTPLQNLCKRRVLNAGGRVFVIRNVDDPELDVLVAWLDAQMERRGDPDQPSAPDSRCANAGGTV